MSDISTKPNLLFATSVPNLITAWRIHLWVFAITIVSDCIGSITIPLGIGSVVVLPLVWSMIIGAVVSMMWRRMPAAIAVDPSNQKAASTIIQIAVLMFIAKLALMVGSSIPTLLQSKWALAFQEIGHFLGTALLGMPIALLLGIKREAVGATFSVGREASIAIIGEKYGLDSPEGRGVMAEYITGTVLGAIFMSIVASLFASWHLFDPLALAMGAGVGSVSMMSAASAAIAAHQAPEAAKDVAAFASASNLITMTVGVYFTMFLSLPFSNKLYALLEPRIGRFGARGRQQVGPVAAVRVDETDAVNKFSVLVTLLAVVGAMALLVGNYVIYHVKPGDAVGGMVIIVALSAIGLPIKRLTRLPIPQLFWVTLIGMALTAPYWPGAAWVVEITSKVNFLSLATPLLAYAGLSLAKDVPAFRSLGWRIVVASLAANAGTFFFASLVAQALMTHAS